MGDARDLYARMRRNERKLEDVLTRLEAQHPDLAPTIDALREAVKLIKDSIQVLNPDDKGTNGWEAANDLIMDILKRTE